MKPYEKRDSERGRGPVRVVRVLRFLIENKDRFNMWYGGTTDTAMRMGYSHTNFINALVDLERRGAILYHRGTSFKQWTSQVEVLNTAYSILTELQKRVR